LLNFIFIFLSLAEFEAERIRRFKFCRWDTYTHIRRHIAHLLDDGGFNCLVRGADSCFRFQA